MMKSLVILLILMPGLSSASALNGSWRLVGQRCDTADGKFLYAIDRYETHFKILLTFQNSTYSEIAGICGGTLLSTGSYSIEKSGPLTATLMQAQGSTCKIDGVTFHTDRGTEHILFSYNFEGDKLVEEQGVCAKGAGVWKWIYERFEEPMS